jgi:uncharacterized protein (DUF302 family)
MLYERKTTGTVVDVVARIERAATENKFGVMNVLDLTERMAAKGVAFRPACRIVEVCNPQQAKTVLETNLSISTALPCRIAVFERDNGITVSTIRPTALLNMFANPELMPVAADVEKAIVRIINAACEDTGRPPAGQRSGAGAQSRS